MPSPHRRHPRLRLMFAVLFPAVLLAGTAYAATSEQQCQLGRYTAAAKYEACQQKALAKLYSGGATDVYDRASGKCSAKYAAVWTRLEAKATGSGSSCDQPRFTDNADGTVTDRLTGLRWEQKTSLDSTANLAEPHDADNAYTWSAGGAGLTAADGTVFTGFLAALNGGCFAGQCDWRLPTLAELQTIQVAPSPCGTSPCIDAIFGPTAPLKHWAGNTAALAPTDAWTVEFNVGFAIGDVKSFANRVRAVRGGL